MQEQFIDAPKKSMKYYIDNIITEEIWEVLDEIYESPIRKYWLVINTEGDLDLIYIFNNQFHQSIFFKNRW